MTQNSLVLIVEDNQEQALMLRIAMEMAGASVRVLPDGEAAMAYFNGIPAAGDMAPALMPSLMVLDLGLPRATGFDVLEWVRDQPALVDLPVVIFTGTLNPFDADHAFALGVSAFEVKPRGPEDLMESIQRIVNIWEKVRQTA